jgi:phospholipid transport system substrate-binding protein
MNTTLKTLLIRSGLVLGLMVAAGAQAQTAQGAPDAFIKATAEDLMTTIKTDKAVLAGDPQRINALVSEKILPNVNLQKMTQSAVGRHWSKASPEQQATLQKEFRILLQRTYGGALTLAKDATLQMRPFRAAADDTDVVVRTNIIIPKGDAVPVDYRMEKTDGAWKVYDLNVTGAWLVQNYQGVFNKQVDNGGIDGLIKFLQTNNGSK